MKPKSCSKKFNIHNENEKILFEANQKGKFILITFMKINWLLNFKVGKHKMLGELCALLERPHQTNHSLRL